MTALWIILAIALALTLLNLLPVGVDAAYAEGAFSLAARIGPARLSAYVVSCSFVPPYLSQPPARGIYRLWDRYQPPLARLSHSHQRRGL